MSDLRTLEEQPFPLRRHFRRRIVPFLVLFIAALVALTVFGARQATEAIYLDLAQRRADTIARAVSNAAPAAWLDLMAGRGTDSAELHKAFADEVHELKLIRLKVYDLRRRTIYDSVPQGEGRIEEGPALRAVIERAGPSAVPRVEPDGTAVYELYVPLLDGQGRVQAVFELYEPIDRIDGILARATAAPLIVPAVLMALLVAALWRLVSRAQHDIDARTRAMVALRRRIESFVSARATEAARGTDSGGTIPSRRLVLSLLYSDVRAFTGFAEASSPEAVVAFLNQLMTIQVRAVHDHGGDVDKLIGDALLAHFSGEDAAQRAVAAARAILEACAAANLPRQVGIGVFTGDVVAGAIGPAERRDYTVVGDSVNVAARLCAAAHGGELVVAAADLADGDGFGAVEILYVKGRRDPLPVRRWQAPAAGKPG
ncbi:MAG: adenylate/guanylate cyclase domain-containing protein [Reyranella sp.]|uniref:adenylate/guanylate cyclase domain-containing protein n=1 Tax=Reyranella sp. TaxID=1929291 RepID=UPI001213EF11|nr:adenylate/guanylate cyclase domain-containing protein [Reyranella sp.]TAJ38731.1 MAG: adenylate/guanylate cyclase domain-containing protein [Reyranella sp.]